jgi:5-methylcytosine-specific restriction endonuclease McrA
MTYNPGRSGLAWTRIRKQVLTEEPNCWLCGQPLDFHAKPRTRWAPSVDHVLPLNRGGPPLDRRNLRAAHLGCNSRRHDGEILRPSRRWAL